MRMNIVRSLIIGLCLIVSSCSSQPSNDQGTMNTSEGTIEIALKTDTEIRLIADGDGVIQSVECLDNEHCTELSLQDLPYAVAFEEIVQKVDLSGTKVMIEVTLSEEQMPHLSTWENTINEAWVDALAKQKVGCSFQVIMQQSEIQQDLIIEDPNTHKEATNIEPYEEVTIDNDGNTITTYYDGQITEVLIEFREGLELSQRMYYDSNNRLFKEVITMQDGNQQTKYYENDLIRIVEKSEGYEFEKVYTSNNILVSDTKITPTSKSIMKYHAEGWLQSSYIENKDGWSEKVYQAKEVLLSEAYSTGWKVVYDMAGNEVERYDVDDSGRPTHIFYLSDGRVVIYTHEFDGTVSKGVLSSSNQQESYIPNYIGEEIPTP